MAAKDALTFKAPEDVVVLPRSVPVGKLQSTLAQLKQERETHLANGNACTGAIQILEKLIAEADHA